MTKSKLTRGLFAAGILAAAAFGADAKADEVTPVVTPDENPTEAVTTSATETVVEDAFVPAEVSLGVSELNDVTDIQDPERTPLPSDDAPLIDVTAIQDPDTNPIAEPLTQAIPSDFPTVELPAAEIPVITEVPNDFPTVELPELPIEGIKEDEPAREFDDEIDLTTGDVIKSQGIALAAQDDPTRVLTRVTHLHNGDVVFSGLIDANNIESTTPDVVTPVYEEPTYVAPVAPALTSTDDLVVGQARGNYIPIDTTNTPAFDFNQAANLDDDTLYNLAKDPANNVHTFIASGKDGNGLWSVNVGASDKVVIAFNSGQLFSQEKFNLELLKLINDYRAKFGLKALRFDDALFKNSKVRADELGLNGYLRFNGIAHSRPGGALWNTVFGETGTDHLFALRGENVAQYGVGANLYALLSERAVAEQMFELWVKSDGHRANMLNPEYTTHAVSVSLSTILAAAQHDGVANNLIATQMLGTYHGE